MTKSESTPKPGPRLIRGDCGHHLLATDAPAGHELGIDRGVPNQTIPVYLCRECAAKLTK